MKKIVLDAETSNLFSDIGTYDPAGLDLSVVAIHDSSTNKFSSFKQDELQNLWPILETADMIIGFNSEHFDIPLLNKYYSGDLLKVKHLDILKEIKSSFGRRMKLDQIAEGTLGINKSGKGTQATIWWRNGEYQKVIDYCIDDVRITKEIYDFAIKNNKLLFKEGGQVITIPLKTDAWETSSDFNLTHTLPF